MTDIALLSWSRGPAFETAVIIFVFGMLLRLLEITLIGRPKDFSLARGNAMFGGVFTLFNRTLPARGTWKHHLPGYIWHSGLLIIILLVAPHILIFQHYLDIRWPALPNSIIDVVTIVTMTALAFVLFTRLTDPVRKRLSTSGDYFSWIVTFLPILTGYLAKLHIVDSYAMMLAIHILSVCLLLIVFPFTKLTHAFTLFFARWYNGSAAGRKGVRQ